MKNTYQASDFKTYYAQQEFAEIAGVIDYDLMARFITGKTREKYIKLLMTGAAKGGASLPETIDLGSGVQLSADEFRQLVLSDASKRVLDVLFTMEEFFQKNKKPEDILMVLQRRRASSQMPDIEDYIRLYPAEATYIRREIVNPPIRQDNDLYKKVMQAENRALQSPTEVSNGMAFIIGTDRGPLIEALTPWQVSALLNIWAGGDITMQQVMAAYKAPKGKPAARPN